MSGTDVESYLTEFEGVLRERERERERERKGGSPGRLRL
jgi:hypothetical protein